MDISKVFSSESVELSSDEIFRIHWIVSRFCNYSCSYCWPESHSNKQDDVTTKENYEWAVDRLVKYALDRGFKNFHITFSGGEPSLHPHLSAIAKRFIEKKPKDGKMRFHMVTNLSRTEEWYKSFITGLQWSPIAITASWHREFSNQEAFTQKALALMKMGISISVNVVLAKNAFDEYLNHAKNLESLWIPVMKLIQRKTGDGYTSEQESILNQIRTSKLKQKKPSVFFKGKDGEVITSFEYPWKLALLGVNTFKWWTCYAGYQSLSINHDGTITRWAGTCRKEQLGNVFDEEWNAFDEPQKCFHEVCGCGSDIMLKKVRNI